MTSDQVIPMAELLKRLGVEHKHYGFDSIESSQATNDLSDADMDIVSQISRKSTDTFNKEGTKDDGSMIEEAEHIQQATELDLLLETSLDDENNMETVKDTANDGNNDSTEEIEDEVSKILEKVDVKLKVFKQSNICPLCNERIDNRNLSRHMKEKHEGRRYSCDDCGKSFLRKYYFEKHVCGEDRSV